MLDFFAGLACIHDRSQNAENVKATHAIHQAASMFLAPMTA